jgi:glycosyltransferase involved in cell wall biosynthesis
MQAFELFIALFQILFNAFKDKPKVVNYSYVSRGNRFILLFLRWLKRVSKCCLIITCHDVIPIIDKKEVFDREIVIKRKIYALADYYLVHTDNSKKELLGMFDVREDKILMHQFPLMDLSKLDKEKTEPVVKYDFLFIGHMRPEKGIDILYNAWMDFHNVYPQSRLCIAGNPNYYQSYLEERKEQCKNNNIELNLGFINDDHYVSLVKASHCVVFPYTGGTNSGVISTVVSLNRDVITSDIGMFADNYFVPKENMFRTGEFDSLFQKMVEYKKGLLVSDSKKRVDNYRNKFVEQVRTVYSIALQQK